MTAPRRRWFRFSLRTMLVVVAGVAVPLACIGYQLNWIRQRHEVLKNSNSFYQLRADLKSAEESGAVIDESRFANFDFEFIHAVQADPCGKGGVPAPFLLRLFGETGQEVIMFPDGTKQSDPEFQRVKKLFPESDVYCDDVRH